MQLASNIESDYTVEELLLEVERRRGINATSDSQRFDRQLDFAHDKSHFKAALCGRRAGKTRELIYELRDSLANHPGDTNVFVELTRPSAKNKLWRPFRRLNDEKHWGLKFSEYDGLRVEHPNGSVLFIVGANLWDEIEKVRGLERLRLACIDECGQQKPANLQYLIEDVLEPGLMDVNGSMLLSGTPGLALTGYWFEVTGQVPPRSGWSTHRWNVYDNPHLNGEEFIKALLERRGWDEDNPIFVREYLGQWVKDLSRLIFAYSQDNVIDRLPYSPRDALTHGWRFVLSMDFGTSAATSFVILGYPPIGRRVYIYQSYKEIGLAPTEVADRARDLIREYQPDKVIGDLHGLGKAYAQEMIKRHGIPIQAADKANKRGVIEFVSDAFRTGQLLNYSENKSLHTELETLLWDEEHKDIADGQDDHETEALVYGYRECPAYANDIALPEERRDDLPKWVDRDGVMVEHREAKRESEPYWAIEEEW